MESSAATSSSMASAAPDAIVGDLAKTFLTVSGDPSLYSRLLSSLERGMPSERIEWKRSFGRSSKEVTLDVAVTRFAAEDVAGSGQGGRKLKGVPVLHILWTECSDLDAYKAYTKDEIQSWLSLLRKCGIATDWAIVLVEQSDARRGANKLIPRTSVLDKIKTDFGGKQPERCLSVIDPTKLDSKTSESWQTLLHRLRLLILQAYNRILGRFEDCMRSQRERRNELDWNFCDYMLLQEELAFVYEMLGVYDEALVQYDELDALFSQFVLNSNVTESPVWLRTFSSPVMDWTGLSLQAERVAELHSRVQKHRPSIFDLRNYIFAKQCSLLFKMHSPWEVAKRALEVLHNCVHEVSIVSPSCPSGALSCWVLLSCLEVLAACDEYSDSSNRIQLYCLFTAAMWQYAREKLKDIGRLCGLLPAQSMTSEHLHCVVELSSGITDNLDHTDGTMAPAKSKFQQNHVAKLKEALSSKAAFQQYYLELSELAISTYKHIGRIRSARFIGVDLARFYLELNQVPQAVTFFLDALKTFQAEGWSLLELQTLRDLAECYRLLGEREKLVRVLVQMACFRADEADAIERERCLRQALEIVRQMDEDLLADGEDALSIVGFSVDAEAGRITAGSTVDMELIVHSHLPMELECVQAALALQFLEGAEDVKPAQPEKSVVSRVKSRAMASPSTSATQSPSVKRSASSVSDTSVTSEPLSLVSLGDLSDLNASGASKPRGSLTSASWEPSSLSLPEPDADPNRLEVAAQMDVRQDGSVSAARLTCRRSLAHRSLLRKDSSGSFLRVDNVVRKTTDGVTATAVDLQTLSLRPGHNRIRLRGQLDAHGRYVPDQLSLRVASLDLLVSTPAGIAARPIVVASEAPRVSVKAAEAVYNALLAGVEQRISICVATGSRILAGNTTLTVACSRGLVGEQLKSDTTGSVSDSAASNKMKSEFVVTMPAGNPFETIVCDLRVMCDLPAMSAGVKDHIKAASVEHKLTMTVPWSSEPIVLRLHFTSPFHPSVSIATCYKRKFVEVTLHGDADDVALALVSPSMRVLGQDHKHKFLLLNDSEDIEELAKGQDCKFIFELVGEDEPKQTSALPILKAQFDVQYRLQLINEQEGQQWRSFSIFPEFKDYKTLYVVSSSVFPCGGGEICRAGNICTLSIEVERLDPTCEQTSIMYEVLVDQAAWAVCGNAAAVIDMTSAAKKTLAVEVMPLVGGHLQLPKVRMSKYIPAATLSTPEAMAAAHSGKTDVSLMPRLEPFAPGQVFNSSRCMQIHVLSQQQQPAAIGANALNLNAHGFPSLEQAFSSISLTT